MQHIRQHTVGRGVWCGFWGAHSDEDGGANDAHDREGTTDSNVHSADIDDASVIVMMHKRGPLKVSLMENFFYSCTEDSSKDKRKRHWDECLNALGSILHCECVRSNMIQLSRLKAQEAIRGRADGHAWGSLLKERKKKRQVSVASPNPSKIFKDQSRLGLGPTMSRVWHLKITRCCV